MRKVGIVLIILLLAIAGVTAAMAYNNATVVSEGDLRISNTNTALLAIIANGGVGNLDATANYDQGEMVFRFGKGKNNVFYGLQPNSEYEWNKLFKILNNSNENLEVTVEVTGDLADFVEIGGADGQWYTTHYGTSFTVSGVQPNWTMDVKVKIEVPSGTPIGDLDGEIVVSAVAQ